MTSGEQWLRVGEADRIRAEIAAERAFIDKVVTFIGGSAVVGLLLAVAVPLFARASGG